MWSRKQVEKFLADRKIDPQTANAIQGRADEMADGRGLFPALALDGVMGGDASLTRDFESVAMTPDYIKVALAP